MHRQNHFLYCHSTSPPIWLVRRVRHRPRRRARAETPHGNAIPPPAVAVPLSRIVILDHPVGVGTTRRRTTIPVPPQHHLPLLPLVLDLGVLVPVQPRDAGQDPTLPSRGRSDDRRPLLPSTEVQRPQPTAPAVLGRHRAQPHPGRSRSAEHEQQREPGERKPARAQRRREPVRAEPAVELGVEDAEDVRGGRVGHEQHDGGQDGKDGGRAAGRGPRDAQGRECGQEHGEPRAQGAKDKGAGQEAGRDAAVAGERAGVAAGILLPQRGAV